MPALRMRDRFGCGAVRVRRRRRWPCARTARAGARPRTAAGAALPPLVAETPVRISAATPFDATCTGATPTDVVYLNAEVEPYVAVNPRDPNNWVATWQQDRWSGGSSNGLITATTIDGGVDLDADGDSVLALRRRQRGQRRRLPARDRPVGHLRARRRGVPDGAERHRRGVQRGLLQRDARQSLDRRRPHLGTGLDADPRRRAVLQRQEHDHRGPDRPALRLRGLGPPRRDRRAGRRCFARTTDGGATWEGARPIYDPGQRNQTIGNVIAVLPNGTVVESLHAASTPARAADESRRCTCCVSVDKGGSWSGPFRWPTLLAVGARDPDNGTPIRDGANLPQIAVAPNGHLWVAWQDARFSSGAHDGIALSRSTDGGRTWSAPVQVNSRPSVPAFTPNVHVLGERHDRRHLPRPPQQHRRHRDPADRS